MQPDTAAASDRDDLVGHHVQSCTSKKALPSTDEHHTEQGQDAEDVDCLQSPLIQKLSHSQISHLYLRPLCNNGSSAFSHNWLMHTAKWIIDKMECLTDCLKASRARPGPQVSSGLQALQQPKHPQRLQHASQPCSATSTLCKPCTGLRISSVSMRAALKRCSNAAMPGS